MNIDEMIKEYRDKMEEGYQRSALTLLDGNNSFETKEKFNDCVHKAKKYEKIIKALEELKKYQQLEENGMLIKIPCKIGDKVYREWSCGKNGKSVAEFTITDINIKNYPEITFIVSKSGVTSSERRFSSKDIGVTVFLDKSELEKKMSLEEDRDEENEFER